MKVAEVTVPVGPLVVIRDIVQERTRQIEVEGWSADHDDEHVAGDLAAAGAAYAAYAAGGVGKLDERDAIHDRYRTLYWPFDDADFKPTNPRRDLVKAAALIIAEIERIDRQEPEIRSRFVDAIDCPECDHNLIDQTPQRWLVLNNDECSNCGAEICWHLDSFNRFSLTLGHAERPGVPNLAESRGKADVSRET
jgi:hypothetical protein